MKCKNKNCGWNLSGEYCGYPYDIHIDINGCCEEIYYYKENIND
ncbi:MAG TPA: hypothetical protein PKI46_01015 [Bacteroidales bacterium]|nr:hypothetical protein [Bacteroidales bacterium]